VLLVVEWAQGPEFKPQYHQKKKKKKNSKEKNFKSLNLNV
jgi:hypothetical protein